MIWFVIFVVFVVLDIVSFLYLPIGNFKEISLIIVSAIVGAMGFSFKDFFSELKIKKKTKTKYKETCNLFNSFFSKSIFLGLKTPETLSADISESEILDNSIREKEPNISGESISIIKLCYFCKKWEDNKSPEDYEAIKKNAESLGIKYAKIDDTVKKFSKIYSDLILNKQKLDHSDINISEKDIKKSIQHFVNNYYKDLQFYEIKDKFHQNKNLHETLIKIIKEGKLSTYGITNETIKRLENDLQKKTKSSNSFVIFTNNTNKNDRNNLKEYLRNFPRLGMAGGTTKMPIYSKFGVYIIKTDKKQTAKSLLTEIKNSVKISEEAIIKIVPLNMANSETYTLPFNQSFTNDNLKKSYQALEWFKTGYDYTDSALWSEITKSRVTPDELLSIIPFNIFCKGILPCEQEFIIKNYDHVKSHFNVNTLVDWSTKNPELLNSYLIKKGTPEYSDDELKIVLKLSQNQERNKIIEKRLLTICKQVVDGAKLFHSSLNPTEL